MTKTVKQLDKELQVLKAEAGNVQVTQSTVWHWEQVAAEVEEYSRYGELIKFEMTMHHSPDKNQYDIIIWHRPLLNTESRQEIKSKGYYAGLEASIDRLRLPPQNK